MTEIAWDHTGRYCGSRHFRYGPLGRTKRIKIKRLRFERRHQCLPVQVMRDKADSLTLPHDANGTTGCGIFICSSCRGVTPWCRGMAGSTRCDDCAQKYPEIDE